MNCLFHGNNCWLDGVDAKTTTELLLALKKDEGYGGEAFRELLHKIEQFKSEVQAVIDDLDESGYYDEANALKGMDFNTLMGLPRAKEQEFGIYEGERVTILSESAGRYDIFIPSRQVQVSVPVEKVEKESSKLDAQEQPPVRHVLKLHIPEVKESEKLYECEKRRNDLIKECAREWMNAIRELVSTYPELREVLDISGTDFWGVAVPTALYDILDSFELTSSVLAAKTFLEEYGRDAVEVDIIDLNRIIDFLDMKQRQSMAEAALQSDTQLAQSLARDADCWSMVKLVLEEKDTEDILKELRS